MQDGFYALADHLRGLLRGAESFRCAFTGECSDFVRFNRHRVRQAGHVEQGCLTVDLVEGRRHAAGELVLSGDPRQDRPHLARLVEDLRDIRAHVPEDPFLLLAPEVPSTERLESDRLPAGAEMVERILAAAGNRDLVGLLARGALYAGFASSAGQRHWDTRHSFNLDWSLYLRDDKAVKSRYAGLEWWPGELEARMAAAAEQLEPLGRPPRRLPPGRYRVYLTPMAVDELMALLGGEGFGLKAQRTRTTPLLRMIEEGACLSPALTVSEDTAGGVAPGFQSDGFLRPPRVTLIENGAYCDALASPRSAAEHGVACNGAEEHESLLSLDVAPGTLAPEDVLQVLGTGLYVGNLWYLNHSDRSAARITGMTRFATFWVQDGQIQAPVEPMRFDETLYHLLGEGLLGIGAQREMLLDPMSYGERSRRSARLPGMVVEGVRFTL